MSTYSSKGDEWGVSTTGEKAAVSSSFGELTKDLVEPTAEDDDIVEDERLDFGMNDDNDNDDNNACEEDDESVDMKDGTEYYGLSDDDDDRTVAMSLADDDDDRTIAVSVADHDAPREDLEDTTLWIPSSEQDTNELEDTNEDPAAQSFQDTAENENESSSPPPEPADDSDDEEHEFDAEEPADAENTAAPKTAGDNENEETEIELDAVAKETAETTTAPKPADENQSEDEESETEFDENMSPAVENDDENELESESAKASGENHESETEQDAQPETPQTKTPESSSSTTPQRSVRSRKPRVLYSAEKREKPKKKAPKKDEWIAATDVLFVQTEDKSAVTVKQIFVALEKKFGCKISKPLKTLVRDRLKALITGTAKASGKDESESENENSSESESSESEEEADDDASAYSEEDTTNQAKRAKKPKRIKQKKLNGRPKRQRATAKAASKVVEAHKLRRQKRLLELKVRNEEMQLDQTKEDEERSEAIAAKFETNSETMRLQRLEDRLDLLQRLDATRISVVATETDENTKLSDLQADKKTANEKPKTLDEIRNDDKEGSSEDEDDSSSDEEDLVIVGMKKPFKPLKPLHNHLPSRGLQLLTEIRSPRGKVRTKSPKRASSNNKETILSPNRSMGARLALKNALKQKQRRQGNKWLARELGYKNEEDHLKDCQSLAQQKRGLVLQQETERLKANERKQLRERLLLQEQQGYPVEEDEEDPEDPAYQPDNEEEEDEEVKLAKQLEQEAAATKDQEAASDGTEDTTEEATSTQDTAAESSQPFETQQLSEPLTDKESNAFDSPQEDSQEGMPAMETQPLLESPVPTTTKVGDSETTATTSDSATTEKVQTTESQVEESVVTPDKKDANDDADDDDDEIEFDAAAEEEEKDVRTDPNRPRNAAWQAMLQKEAEKLKKQKKRKGGLVEEEAEEEEEEEIAGLEDFGFSISKKKAAGDDDDEIDGDLDEDDLKHVVDDVSDNEGDEDAGMAARKQQEQQEEKARHKEILRRMREGYDGRRGGIATGSGARGMHRFDQLVAADNREDAKRLGLLNDDELDSDAEHETKEKDEEEDETALLDKMLKDRFMHRSDVDLEEHFSEDEEEDEDEDNNENPDAPPVDEETRSQERLAKRFAKRARMQRLEELYGDSQEFSRQRLIDEDASMKEELSQMRCGLVRRSSSLSRQSSNASGSNNSSFSKTRHRESSGSLFRKTSGSLSIALRANKRKSSFLGGSKALDGNQTGSGVYKALSLGSSAHVLFHSRSGGNSMPSIRENDPSAKRRKASSNASLFGSVTATR